MPYNKPTYMLQRCMIGILIHGVFISMKLSIEVLTIARRHCIPENMDDQHQILIASPRSEFNTTISLHFLLSRSKIYTTNISRCYLDKSTSFFTRYIYWLLEKTD